MIIKYVHCGLRNEFGCDLHSDEHYPRSSEKSLDSDYVILRCYRTVSSYCLLRATLTRKIRLHDKFNSMN